MPSAARSATAKKSRANLNAGAEPCANPDDAAEYSTRAGQDGVVTKKQGGTVVEAGVMSGWAASVMESLAEALGELGPIDEGAVAPRQAPSANDAAAIKKVRVAVMTALRKKDLPGLAALLASKVDVNFMAKKGLGWQSPLGLAVQHNWLDGVLALVDAGARESLARARNVAEEPAAATDGQAQKKEPWRWIHSDKIFKALVESEDDPEELKKLAKNMIGDVDKALILLRAGKERIGSVELWDSVEHAATENIRARIALHGSAPLEEPAAQTLMALWEQWPERLSVPFDARWETAVRLDQPRMLATLAKGRAAPPKNWEIALRADDIDGAWWERAENLRAQGLSAPSTKVFCDIREGFAGNTRVDLWTFAVAAAAPRCVEALGRVKPLLLRARQGWSNTGHLALFVCSKGTPKKARALREARNLGMDLAACVDTNGENPLHALCQNRVFAKGVIMEMARLRPEWISEKGLAGKTPFDLLVERNAFPGELGEMMAKLEAKAFKKDIYGAKKAVKKELAAEFDGPTEKKSIASRRL